MISAITGLKTRLAAFEADIQDILVSDEKSPHRVISLGDTLARVQGLSLNQFDLFKQSLDCVQFGVQRAAHVMAWAAFMDFLEEKLCSDNMVKLKAVNSGWFKFKSMDDFREGIPEYQLIDAANAVGLITKSEKKTLHGLLSKRNECAHPSGYDPHLNESLGFISELLNRIEKLRQKLY